MGENVQGVRALQRRLKALEDGPEKYMIDWQLKTTASAKVRMRARRPGTGMTADSIQPGRIDRDEAEVHAGGAAVFLEYGTRPHTPPLKAIGRWADRKGKPGIAGAVWAAIRKRGTKAYPFLVPAAEDALGQGNWSDTIKTLWNKAG